LVVKTIGATMLLALSIACGRDKAAPKDSVAAQAPVAAATPGGAPMCQRTGHWSECTVRIRLDQSGLAPQSGADKLGDLPKLAAKPITLSIGNAGVAYYLFPDPTSRRAAAASLDTSRYIVQTRPVSMKNETTLIEDDNVLLLLFSKNEHQRERVADAITAGPPQP
jgi:hypothetical protein